MHIFLLVGDYGNGGGTLGAVNNKYTDEFSSLLLAGCMTCIFANLTFWPFCLLNVFQKIALSIESENVCNS